MSNDTIDFVFANANGEQPLLAPQIVTQLADDLETLLSMLMDFAGGEGSSYECYILLVGAKAGSIRLSFKPLLRRRGSKNTDLREAIGLANDLSSLLINAGKLTTGLLIALGLATPIDHGVPDHRLDLSVPADILKDDRAIGRLEMLVATALRGGADSVTIEIPEAPPALLTNAGSRLPDHLGSLVAPLSDNMGVTGTLEISPRTFRVKDLGEERTLLTGTLTTKTESVQVLIDWRVKTRSVQEAKGTIEISGELHPIQGVGVYPAEPVPVELKRTPGYLIVNSARFWSS